MLKDRLLRLTKDSLVYGIGSVFTSFVGIVLIPILTKTFSPTEYGVIDILFTIVLLGTVLLSFGLDTSSPILFFRTENQQQRQEILSTGFWFTVLISGLIIAVVYPWSEWLSRLLFHDQQYTQAIRYTLAILPFSLAQGFGLSALRFRFARFRYLIGIAVNTILIIGLTLFFVLTLRQGVVGYFQAWFYASVVGSLVVVLLSWPLFKPSISWPILRRLLKLGLPIIPANLSGWSLSLIDRFFLTAYSLSAVGVYSLGVKLSSVLGLVIAAMQLAWGPFALSLAHQPGAKETYAKVLTLYIFGISVIALLITGFSPYVIALISTAEYLPASSVVGALTLGLIAYGAYFIVTVGLHISQKTNHLAWTMILAAVVNIVLNFLLIPHWGIQGAALATFIAYATSTVLVYRMSQRYYPIPFEIGKVVQSIGVTILSVGILSVLPATLEWWWVFVRLGVIGVAIGCYLLLGVIARDELKAVIAAAKDRLTTIGQ